MVDLGATYHICGGRKRFVFIWKKSLLADASIGDGFKLTANFEGHVEIVFTTSYGKFPVQLRNVLYFQTSNVNLLSFSQAVLSRYGSRFEEDCSTIYSMSYGEVALKLDRKFRSYVATATVQHVQDGDVYVVENGK